MGKDSLIKSTTKKKPAAGKEDMNKQAQAASAKITETAKAKPPAKPGKKPVKAKESAPKKPAAKATKTAAEVKKTAPKAIVNPPVAKPSKDQDAKPSAVKTTSYPDTPASADHMPPPEKTIADPADKMLYYGVAGVALLVLIVVIASWMNTHRYYIKSSEGAVSISQGKFAPKGARHLISFPGLQLADPVKKSYTANEVFPIIYRYYLDKADMLLDVPGLPDFEGVKNYLNKSLAYATTREMKTAIKGRLDAINLMVLLYKADVAAGKNNRSDLETARGYLKEALTYQVDEMEQARIKQKAEAVRLKLEELNSATAKAVEPDNNPEQRP